VRETPSGTASTNGSIICSDGDNDGDNDGFAFDEIIMDGLAIFDDQVVTNANAGAPSKIWDVQKSAASSASAASASEAGACEASACFPASLWQIQKYNMPGFKNTLVRTTGNLNMAALGKQHYARLIHMIVPQLPAISRG